MLTDTKIAKIKPPESGQAEHPDHKVTGLRLRVGSTGKKTWTLRRRVGPKVINRKLGNYPAMGLAAARSAASDVIASLERSGSLDAVDRTFGAVAEHWLENVARPKHSSARLQERRLEMHVLPHWRDRKIVQITADDVFELIDGIEGISLPNEILKIVKTVFRYALKKRWIPFSPAEAVEKPKKENARDRWLRMDEVERVWNASALLGYPFEQFIKLLLLTGQRRTEVASMRWRAVDLGAATWLLEADETKSERPNLVPLAPIAVEILSGLPRLGDYVFTTDGDSHISGYAKCKARLDRFLDAQGEGLERWTLHDLRRTVGYHLARLGVSKEIRSRVFNHAIAGVTDKNYNPYDYAEPKRKALEEWAGEVDRAVNSERGHTAFRLERT